MKIKFLGTGTSHGIPMICCNCNVCNSKNPKNKRTRSSVYIEYKRKGILIDTATEFRLQAIKNNIKKVDLILITHCHADHIHGLDDVRRFNEIYKKPIPIFGNKSSINEIKKKFWYVFASTQEGGGKPKLVLNIIKKDIDFEGIKIIPIKVFHGIISVLGYRINNFAYVNDCNQIPNESMNKLKNLDVLVLDALRFKPHSTHFNFEQAIKIVKLLNPKITYFTHIGHDIDHNKVEKELPKNIKIAYDGLCIKI